MEKPVKEQLLRIKSLIEVLNQNIDILNKAIAANKPNAKKSQSIKVAILKKNILSKVKHLHKQVCSRVLKVNYLYDGIFNEAMLTNIEKEDVPFILQLYYGVNYPKVQILEIIEIPTYIKKG